jgi:hypothetical protein
VNIIFKNQDRVNKRKSGCTAFHFYAKLNENVAY